MVILQGEVLILEVLDFTLQVLDVLLFDLFIMLQLLDKILIGWLLLPEFFLETLDILLILEFLFLVLLVVLIGGALVSFFVFLLFLTESGLKAFSLQLIEILQLT